MKLSCTQENLRSALFVLERVVGKQSSLPILSNILLETERGQLRLSATNLEIGVTTSIGAKIESEGKITVPAKLLSNFIQNLSSDHVVVLEQSGMQLILSSGKYTVKINGLDGKDFPIIPEYKGDFPLELSGGALLEGLQKVLYCVSVNESRPELTGGLLSFLNGNLLLTATDSFRLAEWSIETPKSAEKAFTESFPKDQSVIVPLYTLQELSRVLTPETAAVHFVIEENQAFFQIGDVRIVSRLINGRFPEYQQIVPKQFSHSITMAKDEFQRALKIATSFSMYSAGEVMLRVHTTEKELELHSVSQGVGEQVALVPFEGTASTPLDLVFNPRYLLDGVAALDGDAITLACNSATTPVRLSSKETVDRYIYIIMPIRK